MINFKPEEERARLDQIFSEIEAAERGEFDTQETQKQDTCRQRTKAEERLAKLDCKEFIGNIKSLCNQEFFKTKWEKVMAKFIIDSIAPMHQEINVLRNFANSVDNHLQKAIKTAKEQDNHHYYKIFAESVKQLLEKI